MMKRKYTIFYSWQSDTPKDERQLIDSALSHAVDEIWNTEQIRVIVDHSTMGEIGMPDITQSLLRKIDNCDIFLCDLTPITSHVKKDGNGQDIVKQIPNPNVLAELGYAMSVLGVHYIIPLAHQGEWRAQDMPFDINHHRIISFTKSDCDLVVPIMDVIKYINRNGGHRHSETPYWINKLHIFCNNIKNKFERKYKPTTIRQEPTVFFSQRMGKAFHGERGVIAYTSSSDIYRCLKHLLSKPITFDNAEGYGTSTKPIWWFRGGSSLYVDRFKRLGYRRFLIGNDELYIKRIIAYINLGRYYNEYVYVETEKDKPTGLEQYTLEQKEHLKNEKAWTEEYGVFKLWKIIPIRVSRQDLDDGYTSLLGVTVHIPRDVELRIRHICPYDLIIAAKKSSYDNKMFDEKSKIYFDGVLNGNMSIEQFNDFMLSFPKPMD